ncbi:MAG: hypothetical protein AABX89_07760 [Candidatus Thermoplasmatota archaeon]
MRPTWSLTLALVALAGIGWLMLEPPAAVLPSGAAAHEGHGAVSVEGQARNVVVERGRSRFTLHGGGAELDVQVAGDGPIQEGVWLRATGFLARRAGELTLMVAASRSIEPLEPPPVGPTPLAALAASPQDWLGRSIMVEGTVTAAGLGDGEGHRVRIAGDRLPDGAIRLRGVLGYESSCLCYALHPIPAWS